MKTTHTNLKWIAITLSALMLMQSCKVYHSKTASVDEVIESQKRVKIINYSGDIYKFEKLKKENEQLFGISKIKNQEWLNSYVKQFGQGELVGKEVKFLIPDNTIKEYHLQNKTLSTILTISIPVVIIGAIIGLTAIAFSNLNFYGN